jgi:phasin family protein
VLRAAAHPLFPASIRRTIDPPPYVLDWPELGASPHVYIKLFLQHAHPLPKWCLETHNEEDMQAITNNPALKSSLDLQVNLLTDLSLQGCDALRKVSELNLKLARQTVDDSIALARELVTCADAFQMTSVAMNRLEPVGERLRNYQRELMGVVASSQSGFTRSVDHHLPDASRIASAMADQTVRNAASSAAGENIGAAHNPT